MDIEFQYQHTFITAIIKEPQPDDRRRACSLPPMGSEIEVTAAQLEEKDKEARPQSNYIYIYIDVLLALHGRFETHRTMDETP